MVVITTQNQGQDQGQNVDVDALFAGIDAATIAGSASLLTLEDPSLFPGNQHAAPTKIRSLSNEYEESQEFIAWIERATMAFGLRCGCTLEYRFGIAAVLRSEPSVLPSVGVITGAELRQFFVTLCSEIVENNPDFEPLPFRDAILTAMALLYLAGEITIDAEADTIWRTYPALRFVKAGEIVKILRKRLKAIYGKAVTKVRQSDMRKSAGYVTIEITHDGTVEEDQLREILKPRVGIGFSSQRDTYGGFFAFSALLPDGSAWDLWPMGNQRGMPYRHVRYDDLPAGAELVYFDFHKIHLSDFKLPDFEDQTISLASSP